MENTKDFNELQAEINEAAILIDKGVKFSVPKRSILKFFSKQKERTFYIKQPYLGTLDLVSELFLSINLDEQKLQDNPLTASKEIVKTSAQKCAKVVAISVLNSKIMIKLFSGLLASYFLWRIKPSTLIKLAYIINQMNNYGDFINSIRLMSAIRTTAPQNLIEESQAD